LPRSEYVICFSKSGLLFCRSDFRQEDSTIFGDDSMPSFGPHGFISKPAFSLGFAPKSGIRRRRRIRAKPRRRRVAETKRYIDAFRVSSSGLPRHKSHAFLLPAISLWTIGTAGIRATRHDVGALVKRLGIVDCF